MHQRQRKFRRQRGIEGSSEENPIDLANFSNEELLQYIGTGGDDNNGDDGDDDDDDDDDDVVLVISDK